MKISEIKDLIDESKAFKSIAQGYEEIASLKLKKIRTEVERNRVFLAEMSYVYEMVNKIAHAKGIVIRPKNGQVLSIALTSNYRFYGNINNELMRFFIVNTSKYPTKRLVIGQTGISFLEGSRYFQSYEKFNFGQDIPIAEELKKLSDYLRNFSRVLVYYPQMKSVLHQNPSIKDVTAVPNVSKKMLEEDSVDFIFEPEIEKVIQFFDTQITTLLIEQSFLEAELARTASRLLSMDEAQNNAEDYIKENNIKLQIAKRSEKNIRLLEVLGCLLGYRRAKAK